MGGDQPSETTQTTRVELPEWVEKASEENFEFAKDIAGRPLQQYGGERVAGFTPGQKSSFDYFRDTLGAGSGSISAADQALRQLAGFTPGRVSSTNVTGSFTPQQVTADQVKAGKFTDLDLDAYMNPYIENVEKTALGALDDQRIQALMGNADNAIASKAFGGSRSAIVDAVTNAETAKSAGQLSANLRKDAFDTAAGLATGDLNRIMQGDLANQGATLQSRLANQASDLQAKELGQRGELANQSTRMQAELANLEAQLKGAGVRTGAAAGLLDTADAATKARMQNYAGLTQIGQMEQQLKQRQLDNEYSKFAEKRDYPLEQLNILLSSLGMSPYGKTEATQTQANQGSSGTDFAQMGLGILSLLPALAGLSDERLKTDKKKVGTKAGVDIYDYRWKGQSKKMPKTRGPMAQDVEKKYPGAVHDIGGVKVIDGEVLGALRG